MNAHVKWIALGALIAAVIIVYYLRRSDEALIAGGFNRISVFKHGLLGFATGPLGEKAG